MYNSKHFIVTANSCSDDGKRNNNIIQLEYDNNIIML